jgi:hypothetical protein
MSEEDNINGPLYFPTDLSSPKANIIPFSKKTFTDADVASRYLTSDKFREYWSRGNVHIDSEGSFSYRVPTGDNAWLGGQNPSVRRNYTQAIATPLDPVKFSDLLRNDSSLARSNAARVEGRFFTPLVDIKEANNLYDANYINVTTRGNQIPRSVIPPSNSMNKGSLDPFGFYLHSSQLADSLGRGQSGYNRPISMLINSEQNRYRMPNGPWDSNPGMTEEEFLMRGGPGDTIANGRRNAGWDAASWDAVTSGDNAKELARKYGVRLGNSVSSNPEQEIFVPRTMANSARRVGNVVNITSNNPNFSEYSPIEVWGPPRVPVKTQMASNAARITGNALGAVGIIPDIGRLVRGGNIDVGPDGQPYIASAMELDRGRKSMEESTSASDALWTLETDKEAKSREKEQAIKWETEAKEKALRKQAADTILRTKTVEDNINKSPFWNKSK